MYTQVMSKLPLVVAQIKNALINRYTQCVHFFTNIFSCKLTNQNVQVCNATMLYYRFVQRNQYLLQTTCLHTFTFRHLTPRKNAVSRYIFQRSWKFNLIITVFKHLCKQNVIIFTDSTDNILRIDQQNKCPIHYLNNLS